MCSTRTVAGYLSAGGVGDGDDNDSVSDSPNINDFAISIRCPAGVATGGGGGDSLVKTLPETERKKRKVDSWAAARKATWCEEDEMAVLEGMMRFKAETGLEPKVDFSGFYEFVKGSLSFLVSKNQLMDKVKRLRNKYRFNAEKGENPVFSKTHDSKAFKLSKKIWVEKIQINEERSDGNDNKFSCDSKKKGKEDKGRKSDVHNVNTDIVAVNEEHHGSDKVNSVLGTIGEMGNDGGEGENLCSQTAVGAADIDGGHNGGVEAVLEEDMIIAEGAIGAVVNGSADEVEENGHVNGNVEVDAAGLGNFWAEFCYIRESLEMRECCAKSFLLENMKVIGGVKAKEIDVKWKKLMMEEMELKAKRLGLMAEQMSLVVESVEGSRK